MKHYIRKPSIVMAYMFDEFVQYGRTHGANIVNGMPWSFEFFGCSVTHENNHRYILADGRNPHQDVTPNHVVLVDKEGTVSVFFCAEFFRDYTEYAEVKTPADEVADPTVDAEEEHRPA